MPVESSAPSHGRAGHTQPTSVAQQAIWFEHQLEPGCVRFNITTAVRVRELGNLDVLEHALRHILAGVPSLRSTFHDVNGLPVQFVADDPSLDLRFEDMNGATSAQIDDLLEDHHGRPFDIEAGPLVRFLVLRIDDFEHVVAFSIHHLIADLWSNALLGHLLASTYRDFLVDDVQPVVERSTYAEHVDRESAFLRSERLAGALEYWSPLFESWVPQPVPSDRPAPRRPMGLGDAIEIPLDPVLVAGLRGRAEQLGVSARSVVLGVYQALLHRNADLDNVVVAEIKANRSARMAMTIGCCINQVPRAAQFDSATSLHDVVMAADAATRASRPHEAVPFATMLHNLRPGHGHEPFFQASFAFQKTSRVVDERLASALAIGSDQGDSDVSGFSVEPVTMPVRSAPDPLTLLMVSSGDQIRLSLEYQVERFDPITAERLGNRMAALLSAFVVEPHSIVADVELFGAADRQHVDQSWQAAKTAAPSARTALDLIAQATERYPDKVAVRDDAQAMTYRDLETRSSHVAQHLQRAGCAPGDLVGICLDRSVDVVVAMLAVWRCGAGYVPMDPQYPAARLRAMVDDGEVALVMSTEATWRTAMDGGDPWGGDSPGPRLFDLDTPAAQLLTATSDQSEAAPDPNGTDLAYVIFTSGSTGRPKGVAIEHRNVVNFVESMSRRPGISASDIVLATTTLSFDISLLELIAPLAVGATVRLATSEQTLDTTRLAGLLNEVTIAQATPTLWSLLVESGWQGNDSLTLLCGGEALSTRLADQLLERCAVLWNMYGPTETTVWSSSARILPGSDWISTGEPIDNTALHVLDKRGRQVPPGIPGELWISGLGVARGYLGRPDLTAARFREDRFIADAGRMYRTGDLVVQRSDLRLEYLGRLDSQVKLRGHRIELGEVEAVVSEHPAVQEAVASIHDFGSGDLRLVVYLRRSGLDTIDSQELRAWTSDRLPSYMVPNIVVNVEQFAQTLNGKIDRTRLPDPGQLLQKGAPLASASSDDGTLTTILQVFRTVLQDAHLGPDDDFFAAGGHSIHATQIASRLREQLEREVPVAQLFDHPTARALAAVAFAPVAVAGARSVAPAAVETDLDHQQTFEVSSSQQRMWYAQVLAPGTTAYNLAGQLRIRGPFDLDSLNEAFAHVVERHTSLRTTFSAVNGLPEARVHRVASADIEVHDHTNLAPSERLAVAREMNASAAGRAFDLSRLPLARLVAHRLGDNDHLIAVVIHHIVCDQWSLGILLAEMNTLLTGGSGDDLPNPGRSELYAAAQNADLGSDDIQRQLLFWRNELDGMPRTALPSSSTPTPAAAAPGASLSVEMPRDLVEAVRNAAERHRASDFMIQLAAMQLFMFEATGQSDIGIGVPIANRHWRESESLITSLVNTVVLRTQLRDTMTVTDLIGDVRQRTLAVFANQDVPFEYLAEKVSLDRRSAATPLFSVFFNVQNAPIDVPSNEGVHVEFLPLRRRAAQFDFALTVDSDLTKTLTAEYSTALYTEGQVREWLRDYAEVLARVADPTTGDDRFVGPASAAMLANQDKPLPSPEVVQVGRSGRGDRPRPGTEAEVAEIWQRLLKIEDIRRDDDFFDLGGHSILAVRLIATIAAERDRQLPVSLLLHAPTVATFAEALDSGGWITPWTSLIRLTTGSTDANFFYVSPFLISSLSFRKLGALVGGRTSFFALQPQGLEDDHPIHTSVEQMAAHYVSELRSVQPVGPYRLGGHCAGGWVAFEMARQLQATGDVVENLVIVDVEPPGIHPPKRRWISFLASRLVLYGAGGRIFHALRWQAPAILQRRRFARHTKGSDLRDELVRDAHREAHNDYRGGRIAGDLSLIRSEEWDRLPDKQWHRKWSELVEGDTDVAIVPGAHARLLDGDGVIDLAAIIQGIVDRP